MSTKSIFNQGFRHGLYGRKIVTLERKLNKFYAGKSALNQNEFFLLTNDGNLCNLTIMRLV